MQDCYTQVMESWYSFLVSIGFYKLYYHYNYTIIIFIMISKCLGHSAEQLL